MTLLLQASFVFALFALSAIDHCAGAAPRLRGIHVAGAYYAENQQLGAPTQEWFDYLQQTGVDWVGVSISMFSDSLANPTVYVRARLPGEAWVFEQTRTFSDEQLIGFTNAAHAHGIRVYWTLAFDQPVFDPGQGDPQFAPDPRNCATVQYNVPRYEFGQYDAPSWNRCIPASEWWWNPAHPQHAAMTQVFFQSMTDVAKHYGALAQTLGVDMYSLGTETEQLWRTRATFAPSHFRTQLQAMVNAVRGVYSGVLTYDQWIVAFRVPTYFGNDEYMPVFADLGLDVIGLSLYDGILTAQSAGIVGVPELKAGWLNLFNNQVAVIKAANKGLPVILTEFGMSNGINGPWRQGMDLGQPITMDANHNGVFDGDEQLSNTLTAFGQAVDASNGMVTGGFLWGQPVFFGPPAAGTLVDYPLYGRPPADALGSVYRAWGTTWPRFPAPQAGTQKVNVVEYRQAGWDHYFITADTGEQALLGKPPFDDWQPTGNAFYAYDPAQAPETSQPVCRFFNVSFVPKSTHFYALPAACQQVLSGFPDWILEKPQAFNMLVPDASGNCPSGSIPVYRLYNNGQGGAPNHRFVTSATDRAAMLARGYVSEGSGALGVGMCAPS
ncbi:MAG: hypothetical protein ABI440_09725 [Casimicrobiaceae bacterium]